MSTIIKEPVSYIQSFACSLENMKAVERRLSLGGDVVMCVGTPEKFSYDAAAAAAGSSNMSPLCQEFLLKLGEHICLYSMSKPKEALIKF